MNERIAVLGILLFSMVVMFPATTVSAHSPANVTIEYDYNSQVLTVTVTHSVSNVNTHYISQIIIEKNSVQVASRDYTSQDTTTSMTDTFNIDATQGDVLEATAICNIAGSGTDQITITDPASATTSITTTTTSSTSPPPEFPMTLTIFIVVVVFGIVAVIAVFLKRR